MVTNRRSEQEGIVTDVPNVAQKLQRPYFSHGIQGKEGPFGIVQRNE